MTPVLEVLDEKLQPTSLGDWRKKLQSLIAVIDLLAITLAVGVGYAVRFGFSEPDIDIPYWLISLLLVVAWMGSLIVKQSYNPELFAIGTEEYRRVVTATFLAFGTFAIVAVIFRGPVARGYLAVAMPLGLILLLVGRLIARRFLVRSRAKGRALDQVIVIGSAAEVDYVVKSIMDHPATGYQVAAVCTDDSGEFFVVSNGKKVPQAGKVSQVMLAVKEWGASTIIVAGHKQVDRKFLRQLGWQLEDTDLHLAVASSMTDVAGPRIHWRPVEGLPLMSVEMPRYAGWKYSVKRVFDLVFSGFGLLLVSPIILCTALAIRFDSRGPVFFRQERVGVRGATFKMTKFRSMVPDAENRLADLKAQDQGNGMLFKMKDDPRITRVGAFIRRYSIDELPQLFDVFRGKMSLVGPRPPLPEEVQEYQNHVRRRLNVKPGITGPWQVSGRSDLTREESIRKDLSYVENWSIAGDILILFKTVKVVVTKDGAY